MNTIDLLKKTLLKSNFEEFESLLENYDIGQQDEYGNNILHYYVKESENIDIDYRLVISTLLKQGISIDDKQLLGRHNRSALHLAVFMKLDSILDYLIALGADINSTDGNGNPPLFTAVMFCRGGSTYFIEKLIKSGADLYLKNDSGVSPKDLIQNISNRDYILSFT